MFDALKFGVITGGEDHDLSRWKVPPRDEVMVFAPKPPEDRVALRQQDAKPVFDELEIWLAAQLSRISGKSELAKAVRYALDHIKKMGGFLENGFLEMDNNCAERSIRCVALGRKNSHDLCQGYARKKSSADGGAYGRYGAGGLLQGAEVLATVAQTLIRGSYSAP